MISLLEEGNSDTRISRMLCDDGGRDQSDEPIRQGRPKIAGNHQKLEKSKAGSSGESSEGAWLYQHLDF